MTFFLKSRKFFITGNAYFGLVDRLSTFQVSACMIDFIHQFQPPRSMTELWNYLYWCKLFQHFMPNFASVVASWNKKLLGGQLQAFDWLTEDKISAVKTPRSVEPICCLLYVGKAATRLTQMHGTYISDLSSCKNNLTDLTDQPDIGLVLLIDVKEVYDTTKRDGLVWRGQQYCSSSTEVVVDFFSGTIRKGFK